MKNRKIENVGFEEEVIWESMKKYYIRNEEVDHATWFSSILTSPKTAYKVLNTEKTGKNDENSNKNLCKTVGELYFFEEILPFTASQVFNCYSNRICSNLYILFEFSKGTRESRNV